MPENANWIRLFYQTAISVVLLGFRKGMLLQNTQKGIAFTGKKNTSDSKRMLNCENKKQGRKSFQR